MSKIAILTDSSCDIPQELAEKYGMKFYFGLYDSGEYWDTGDMTTEIEANRQVDKIFVPSMEEGLRNQKYTDWKRAVERSRNWER